MTECSPDRAQALWELQAVLESLCCTCGDDAVRNQRDDMQVD